MPSKNADQNHSSEQILHDDVNGPATVYPAAIADDGQTLGAGDRHEAGAFGCIAARKV